MTLATQKSPYKPCGSHDHYNQTETKGPEAGNKKKTKKKTQKKPVILSSSVQLQLTTPKSCKLSITSNRVCSTWLE